MANRRSKRQSKAAKLRARKPNLAARMLSAPSVGGAVIFRDRDPVFESDGVKTIVHNTEVWALPVGAALGAFSVSAGPIIPSNIAWINTVASAYAKYKWNRIRFIYIPSVPTTTPGSIVLTPVYDYLDTPPTNLVTAQASFRSVTTPPWGGYEGTAALTSWKDVPGAVTVDIDVKRLQSAGGTYFRYITMANFNPLSNADKNIYAPVQLLTSTGGGPATATNFGTVFIKYEIELIEPIFAGINQ